MRSKSISLVMYGIRKCSGICLYCSAASTMSYRDKENGNSKSFKFDKEKTRARILEYTEVEKDLAEGIDNQLHIDIWGGNPLENFEEFKQVVEFIKNDLKEFKQIYMSTSGNGLELQSDDLVQYLIDNQITYQLSHDGYGQWLRTGDIDPIYWEKTKDNIVKLAKLGIFNMVNTTLNAYNFSFFSNIEYWNKWRMENDLMDVDLRIKLNHIYSGTPPVEKTWFGNEDIKGDVWGTKPCKKGEVIGDLNLKGRDLNLYLHELRKLGFICLTPGIENVPEFRPYVDYIKNQVSRWRIIKDDIEAGSCRAFQMGLKDKNFPIDTLGEYCQCNLIDSSTTVKNPSGKRPEKCKDCIYKDQAECHPCGSEVMAEDCEYLYHYCQVLEEFEQLKELLQTIEERNGCGEGGCGDKCNCKEDKNKDAVYCVKRYTVV